MKKRVALLLAGILTLSAFLLTGCGEKEQSGGKTPEKGSDAEVKDTLVVAQYADPIKLDPQATETSCSTNIMLQIYENLLVMDKDMNFVPQLAESWKFNEDGTELTFNLRKGVKFHNGEEMKASDVKFTLERGTTGPSSGMLLEMIKEVKVDNDYTATVVLSQPFAPILAHLAHPVSAILSEKAVTEAEANGQYGNNPIGTGPFVFKNWNPGDKVVLERYEDYWGAKPAYKTLEIRTVVEANSRSLELETGGIDIALRIQPNDVKRMDENEDIKMLRSSGLTITYIPINTYYKGVMKPDREPTPLLDERIRQAINYAVDMPALVKNVYFGAAAPATGYMPSSVWGFDKELPPYEYNVEKAKALMKEAGYENGLELNVICNDNQDHINACEIIKNQLQKIGITLNIQTYESAIFFDNLERAEYDLSVQNMTVSTCDPDYAMYLTLYSQSPYNRNYENKHVDELLVAARKEIDPEKRAALYKEAQEITWKEAAWLPIAVADELVACRSNINGFDAVPSGYYRFAGVTFD